VEQGHPGSAVPELFSFACNSKLTIKEAKQKVHLFEICQLPLSVQAYEQYLELNEAWGQITVTNAKDIWKLIWGSEIFSTKKTYAFDGLDSSSSDLQIALEKQMSTKT
jgi:hypothetical protein